MLYVRTRISIDNSFKKQNHTYRHMSMKDIHMLVALTSHQYIRHRDCSRVVHGGYHSGHSTRFLSVQPIVSHRPKP